jgi:hypothetical protein
VTDEKMFIAFYLPHMEYEGSIGFVMRRNFFIADFHVLGLSRSVAVRKICTSPTGSALSARKVKFWLPESFGPT